MTHSPAATQVTSSAMPENLQKHPGTIMVVLRHGLQLQPRLPFDKWLHIGKQLSAVRTSSAWCLGDWLAYGIEAFGDRYRTAIEQTSLDYQTLRNYVWVAKRFPRSRRRVTLSFGHHAEVAGLAEPEQDFWLRKAEELGWSVKKLRQEVRASLRERKTGSETLEDELDESNMPPGFVKLDIRIGSAQFKSCQTAAAKAGLEIHEWVVKALTKVADDALGTHLSKRTRVHSL